MSEKGILSANHVNTKPKKNQTQSLICMGKMKFIKIGKYSEFNIYSPHLELIQSQICTNLI